MEISWWWNSFQIKKHTILNISRDRHCVVYPKLQSSDDIILFMIVVDLLKKDFNNIEIVGRIDYFPYMQADRNFEFGECFSLKNNYKII